MSPTADAFWKVIAEMRLRKVGRAGNTSPTLNAWADRLEALVAEVSELRAAAQPFAQFNSSDEFIEIRVPTSAVTRLRQALRCKQSGCTQTDNLPCSYTECPRGPTPDLGSTMDYNGA